MSSDPRPGPATRAVHAGHLDDRFGAVSTPVYRSSTFRFPTLAAMLQAFRAGPEAMVYTRYNNPTIEAVEAKLADTEGAEAALTFASGMAAISSTMLSLLAAGDRVLVQREIYGGAHELFTAWGPRLGWQVDWFGVGDGAALEAGLARGPKVVYAESPTNPLLRVVDLAALAARAHAAGAALVVDNTFATGHLQKPLALGADVVVYSATKHIDGQGRVLGGVILSDQKFVTDHLHTFLRQTGPSLSPFNAWVLLKGLETLGVRVERQTRSAALLADRIAAHPKVKRVFYPFRDDHPQAALARKQMSGGSNLIAFEVAGGRKGAFAVANALEIVRISNNLGDAKSLVTHPSTTTHQRFHEAQRLEQGITQGLLRLSVGLEDPEDLAEDIEGALSRASGD
jgi:O-succinylhomoserine sulfhydrylase